MNTWRLSTYKFEREMNPKLKPSAERDKITKEDVKRKDGQKITKSS